MMRVGQWLSASRVSVPDGTAGSDELCRPPTSSNGGRRTLSTQTLDLGDRESFAVAVRRRDDLTVVDPRGALDIASVGTLRAVLDDVQIAGGLMLDLRGLSFIDSTGLHLLVALDRRAQRDGFELRLVAPAPPVDKAIRLCGLDQV